MDFQLNDEQRALQEAARRFAQNELRPLARELEEKDEPVPHDWLARYGALGFLGINTPERYCGLGLGPLEALLVLEEFARISVAGASPAGRSTSKR